MAGNKDFSWIWSSARGHSGGMAVGVKIESLEIEDSSIDTYSICLLIRNRVTNFRFWLVNVYGPADHVDSEGFIQELSVFCEKEMLPFIIGGNFNLIRNNKERNHGQGDPRLMEMFNNFIGRFQLREIFVNGSKFTWSNKQKVPTMEKLDKILASKSWENNFPTCFSYSKARYGSDHCPLILNTGEQGVPPSRYFYFEDKWLLLEGFDEMLCNKWRLFRQGHTRVNYSLDKWQDCLQQASKFLRGWNLSQIGKQREIRNNIIRRIQQIDLIAKNRLLSM